VSKENYRSFASLKGQNVFEWNLEVWAYGPRIHQLPVYIDHIVKNLVNRFDVFNQFELVNDRDQTPMQLPVIC